MINNLFTLTLLKAFDILDCFERDDQEISIKDIAGMIDMPQSSVYRIIQSLEFIGLIFQNKENKKYRIGAKLIQMSEKMGCLDEYMQIAVKYMQELNRETEETVNLAIAAEDKILYIYKVESKHLLRPNFELYAKHTAYNTGLGKVLLSEMSTPVLMWVYENNKEGIGKTFEEFKAMIDAVGRQGFAYDEQEFSLGLRCVAAPIKGPGGKILFSVSISAPIMRMDDEAYARTRDLVVKYAEMASNEIRGMES